MVVVRQGAAGCLVLRRGASRPVRGGPVPVRVVAPRGAGGALDRKLGEAIDIYVNNRLVARGEVVMVDETRLGVTMTEIVKADRA